MNHDIEQFLNSYNEKIVQKKLCDDQKFLIYSIRRHELFSQSSLVGGLADRLKGIIASFYMAAVTGRRFVIDWDRPFDICDNLLPSRYDWRLSNANRFIKGHTSVRHIDLIDRSGAIDDMSVDEIGSDLLGDDPVVVLNINSPRVLFFLRHFEEAFGVRIGYGDLFTQAFRFLFKFVEKDEFLESREAVRNLRSKGDMLTAVHLRTGAGNGWRDPDLDDWRNYEKIMLRSFSLSQEKGAKNPVFYFVSDSVDARKAVSERSWPFPVVCDQFIPVHMDRSGDADRHGNDLTYHEFQMLSESDYLVCGKGGFASLAAHAGGKPINRYEE